MKINVNNTRFIDNSSANDIAIIDQLVNDDTFSRLINEYPRLSHFDRHSDITRPDYQRPHNRYYCAYEESIYASLIKGENATINEEILSPSWSNFINTLKSDATYHHFIREFLGRDDYNLRFCWHSATTGDDVSPHIDSPTKLGTHLFYLNTEWRVDYGGTTNFLSELNESHLNSDNYEIHDFKKRIPIEFKFNQSVLFKNTKSQWHGVDKITEKPPAFRQLFCAIFQENPS